MPLDLFFYMTETPAGKNLSRRQADRNGQTPDKDIFHVVKKPDTREIPCDSI
jgi:hypothetical protein